MIGTVRPLQESRASWKVDCSGLRVCLLEEVEDKDGELCYLQYRRYYRTDCVVWYFPQGYMYSHRSDNSSIPTYVHGRLGHMGTSQHQPKHPTIHRGETNDMDTRRAKKMVYRV